MLRQTTSKIVFTLPRPQADISRVEIPRSAARPGVISSSSVHDPVGGSHGNPHPTAGIDSRAWQYGSVADGGARAAARADAAYGCPNGHDSGRSGVTSAPCSTCTRPPAIG